VVLRAVDDLVGLGSAFIFFFFFFFFIPELP